MTRMLGWIFLLAALAVCVLWMVEHPGTVDITWLGYEIRVQMGILLALAFFGCLLLIPALLVLRYLLGLPSSLRGRSHRHRQQKGFSALTSALAALAESDTESAARHMRKTAGFLGESPLLSLLGAQIAYRRDDTGGTQHHLRDMLEYDETKGIAARALSSFARREGNYAAAIAFARDALDASPKSLWGYRSLCDLYIREERWQEAELLIKTARRKRRIDAGQSGRLLAVLYYVQATRNEEQGQPEIALRGAWEAHRQDRGFLPAAVYYARLVSKKGEKRKALAMLETRFKAMPHPELSEALLDLCREEPAQKLTRRAAALAGANPEHPESYYLQAMVAIRCGQWDAARAHVKTALLVAENARAYTLLAAIETGQSGDRATAAEWLAHAAEVPPDPVWICTDCDHRHKRWQLHCQHCDSFDALVWDTPKAHHDRRPASFLLERLA